MPYPTDQGSETFRGACNTAGLLSFASVAAVLGAKALAVRGANDLAGLADLIDDVIVRRC